MSKAALAIRSLGLILIGSLWGQVFIDQNRLRQAPAALTNGAEVSSLEVTVTVLRCLPTARTEKARRQAPLPTVEELANLRSPAEVVAALRGPEKKPKGKVSVLYHGARGLLLAPAGQAGFSFIESRPAFLVGAPQGQNLTNRLYGLELMVAADRAPGSSEAGAAAPARIRLTWQGRFLWSQDLLAKWEKLAEAAFQWASRIPGATYQLQEPDEDGFVSSSGGVNLGGLFRKKKPAEGAAGAGRESGAPAEPSYVNDAGRTEVPLQGEQWLQDQQLAVVRFSREPAETSGELLYLVLQPSLRP